MPCLADLPSSKALHRDNADLPIAYIYLCTSSSSAINLWKNKVVELEIPGTHIFVDDKIVTQLKEKLGASGGFPSYVVIGKEGKVSPSLVTRMQHLNRESLQKIAEFK